MLLTSYHHNFISSSSSPKPFRRSTTVVVAFSHRATSSSSTTDVFDLPAIAVSDYQLLFASQRSETNEPILLKVTHGSIPSEFPQGTYYLVGPGLFFDDYGSTIHPLDGHGYLRTFEFGPSGRVRYSARYVSTEAQREEWDRGTGRWRFTHRGPFSVLRGGQKLGNLKVMKNVANSSVLKWGNRLMCLWEGGEPYEIDPRSLETMGPFVELNVIDEKWRQRRFAAINVDSGIGTLGHLVCNNVAGKLLRPILQGVFNMPPKRTLAHYKIDYIRNRLLLISCNTEDMLLPKSNFTFYEFDSNFQLMQKKEFSIQDHLMIHDWTFTENHYVILGNRIKLDVAGSFRALSGLHPMISALSVNPSQPSTPIYLLPRFTECCSHGRDWKQPIKAPSQLWSLHVGNAFEESDVAGNVKIQIHTSVCSYQWFNFNKMFGYKWNSRELDPSFMNMADGEKFMLPHIVQISIRLDTKGKCLECSVSDPSNRWTRSADFPAINPGFTGRHNTYMYAATASGNRQFLLHFPYDSIVKLNLFDGSASLWHTEVRTFVGEPVFVPKGVEEDDGYILVVEYAVSKQKCHLVLLDAKSMGESKPIIARIEVPKHLTFPLGFHGFWSGI